MIKTSILWVDDEIDLLRVSILFLEQKGYEVTTLNNGFDAVELVKKRNFDILFIDENMPGISGLETLSLIKEQKPGLPIVMITKNEEENIMDQAIGSKIADYLIKPVNPNQILLSIKKNVDNKRLVSQKTTTDYRTEFTKLGQQINTIQTFPDWAQVYKKLVFWEIELEKLNDKAMDEILQFQKNEANNEFCKYIENNYIQWFGNKTDTRPLMQPDVFKSRIFPELDLGEQVFLIVVDNLRYDQWRVMQPLVNQFLNTDNEEILCSILPTATQYARNALFAGLMPNQIAKMFPQFWRNDDEEGGKNEFEADLVDSLLTRYRKKIKFQYEKIQNKKQGLKLVDSFKALLSNQLNIIVYNFVDTLSHARTESQMLRELAYDEPAFRSLALTWFEHSSLLELIKEISAHKATVFITTDHGTIRVSNPVKVVGDKETSANLRYKTGRNLNYNAKEVFEVTRPSAVELPSINLSSSFIFARNHDFLAYPNNYNHYVRYYKDSFQHGGISMEEMLIPFVTLRARK